MNTFNLTESSHEVTLDFFKYLHFKKSDFIKAADIGLVYLLIQGGYNSVRGCSYYYQNRINNLEMFWEKKLFEYFIKNFKENCIKNNSYVEICNIDLSSLIYSCEFQNNYELKRGMIINFKIKKNENFRL